MYTTRCCLSLCQYEASLPPRHDVPASFLVLWSPAHCGSSFSSGPSTYGRHQTSRCRSVVDGVQCCLLRRKSCLPVAVHRRPAAGAIPCPSAARPSPLGCYQAFILVARHRAPYRAGRFSPSGLPLSTRLATSLSSPPGERYARASATPSTSRARPGSGRLNSTYAHTTSTSRCRSSGHPGDSPRLPARRCTWRLRYQKAGHYRCKEKKMEGSRRLSWRRGLTGRDHGSRGSWLASRLKGCGSQRGMKPSPSAGVYC